MRNVLVIIATFVLATCSSFYASAGAYRYELFRIGDDTFSTVGFGIDNNGNVSGTVSLTPAGIQRRGFIRNSAGDVTFVDHSDVGHTWLRGNNNLGQSVGHSVIAGSKVVFIREPEGEFTSVLGFEELRDINDLGQLLGSNGPEMAIKHVNGDITYLTAGELLLGGGINNQGVVVASAEYPSGLGGYISSGIIYDSIQATWQTVEYPGAHSTLLCGINNLNHIYGQWTSTSGDGGLFVRHPDGTFDPVIPPAPGRIDATDINDHGQITGLFQPDGESIRYGFIATPVPEPSSLALLALGAGALAVMRRRAMTARELWFPGQIRSPSVRRQTIPVSGVLLSLGISSLSQSGALALNGLPSPRLPWPARSGHEPRGFPALARE